MTHTINHNAYGPWSHRVGEPVTVTGTTPNGMAAWVRLMDGTKIKGPLPVKWLTEKDEA
jgi:hypothetical protein